MGDKDEVRIAVYEALGKLGRNIARACGAMQPGRLRSQWSGLVLENRGVLVGAMGSP